MLSPTLFVVEPASCDVYWARTSWLTASHRRLLDGVERIRAGRYVHEADRVRFTLAAALLRLAAGAQLELAPERLPVDRTCPRCHEPHGRPRLVGQSLQASVSHSGEFVAVALTEAGAVGVDIEQVRVIDHLALSPELYAPGESAQTDPDAFYTVWTRKESVLKATGIGLELPMTEVRITPPSEPPRLLSYRGVPRAAQLSDLSPGAGYAGAVAVLSEQPVAFRPTTAAKLLGVRDDLG